MIWGSNSILEPPAHYLLLLLGGADLSPPLLQHKHVFYGFPNCFGSIFLESSQIYSPKTSPTCWDPLEAGDGNKHNDMHCTRTEEADNDKHCSEGQSTTQFAIFSRWWLINRMLTRFSVPFMGWEFNFTGIWSSVLTGPYGIHGFHSTFIHPCDSTMVWGERPDP